jgi:arginase
MLALRRRGHHGLIFIDGHTDFRHPGNAEFVGAAAGEDLALVTGRGDSLANLDGLGPLVRDTDVVVLGVRAASETDELLAAGMRVYTSDDVRVDPGAVARAALEALSDSDLDGLWIHCDVDVLDSSVMPAVDTPEPGGLNFPELTSLLAALLASDRACGLELTIFDPDLDESGRLAERLTDCICDAFAVSLAHER